MKMIKILAAISYLREQLTKVMAQEHSSVVFFRLLSWLLYTLEGKFFAFLVGWEGSYLGRGSRVIGTRAIQTANKLCIGRYAWIEAISENNGNFYSPCISIGQRFFASERLHISAVNRIEIGDDCLFGSCVYISDHNHGSYKGQGQSHPGVAPVLRNVVSHGPVFIGSNVWIGDNVTIVGPVSIGDGVVVGANSVVTHDVSNNTIVGGVPAKILKRFNESNGLWEVSTHS